MKNPDQKIIVALWVGPIIVFAAIAAIAWEYHLVQVDLEAHVARIQKRDNEWNPKIDFVTADMKRQDNEIISIVGRQKDIIETQKSIIKRQDELRAFLDKSPLCKQLPK